MEKTLRNGGDPKMFVVKLNYPQQVMTEKWLLVLLIVGCTSLVFLICFPIDFYLYRRRKRLARERKNLTMYRPQKPTRAAQAHSKLTAKVATEINVEQLYEDEQRKYRTVRRFSKMLSIFKNKSPIENTEMLEIGESLADKMPEKTDFLQTIPESLIDEQLSIVSTTSSDKSTSQNVNRSDKNSADGRTASRKFSYDLMDWRGRKQAFKSEHKGLRYGAHEPFENMTNIFDESSDDKRCFTIPVKSGNLGFVEPETHTSGNSADLEFHDSHESQTDIILESDAFGDNVKENVLGTDITNRTPNIEKGSKGVLCDSKVVKTGDIVKPCKILRHSQSDQCIIEMSKHQKLSGKGGRKRNSVTPTETLTFSFPDPVHIEDSPTSKEKSLHLPPLVEQSLITKFKKKNRKRKNSSCSSMPELPYEREKY